MSPDNPLTARVIVNRVWQHHFGEGLVRTPSDFGVMGEKPTHPELLDWLAGWFMDNGWSIKQLHRLILESNAYRMSKQWNAEYAAKDPEDRLLWRMPYQRLEVEAIRDSALAASGQLNPAMFGPSMYPHIPPAALEGSSDPDKIWKESDETEASRRTIYAFLKRSMVVPMLEVLDSFGKKGGQWAGRRGGRARFREADLARVAPGFDRFAERLRHPHRIGCDRDRGVHENGIGTHLERFGRLARRAEAGVDDHRHGRLFDDDFDLRARFDAAIAADRRTERHHRRRAHILQTLRQHRVGIDVRQDGKAFLHEDLRRGQSLDRVGQQISRIGMNLEFDPGRQPGG